MTDIRYGFYLRPSFAMCRAQVEIHDLLQRQYGLQAAGKFMPHATIKGFFRSDAPVETMVSRLDTALAGHRALTVYNNGAVAFGTMGIALRIQFTPEGAHNGPLQALHQAALDALLSLVHPQCDFTPHEWLGERFDAHLTLAMADLKPQFFDEILRFVKEAEPIGPASFLADTFQLFAFESDDWAGRWWETLRWELRHSWRLPE
jgi:2'-5' RNA ligase